MSCISICFLCDISPSADAHISSHLHTTSLTGQYIINPPEQKFGLGSARIFDLTTGLQTHVLVVDDGENIGSEYYGYTVALDGDTALVGVYRDSDYKGRAFVFVHDSVMDMWNQQGIPLRRI